MVGHCCVASAANKYTYYIRVAEQIGPALLMCEWAGGEEEEGFITSFNKSQGHPISGEFTKSLWQSRRGWGGSLGASFNTLIFFFSFQRFDGDRDFSMWLAFCVFCVALKPTSLIFSTECILIICSHMFSTHSVMQ